MVRTISNGISTHTEQDALREFIRLKSQYGGQCVEATVVTADSRQAVLDNDGRVHRIARADLRVLVQEASSTIHHFYSCWQGDGKEFPCPVIDLSALCASTKG